MNQLDRVEEKINKIIAFLENDLLNLISDERFVCKDECPDHEGRRDKFDQSPMVMCPMFQRICVNTECDPKKKWNVG